MFSGRTGQWENSIKYFKAFVQSMKRYGNPNLLKTSEETKNQETKYLSFGMYRQSSSQTLIVKGKNPHIPQDH